MEVFKQVFSDWRYSFGAITLFILIVTLVVLGPQFELIQNVWGGSNNDWAGTLTFTLSLYGLLLTNSSVMSSLIIICSALLFAINLSLIVYLLNIRKRVTKSGVISNFWGLASGIFGVGCAACGSLALTTLLPFIGATGFLALLPFGGEEFGVMGIILLTASTYLLMRKISIPSVCVIKN